MARDNRLWGAERIRGELLKLGLHVCKRTIQKYKRAVRTTSTPSGQLGLTDKKLVKYYFCPGYEHGYVQFPVS